MITRTRLTALAATAALAAAALITAAPASAAVTCASPVWRAQYFGNSTFGGTPKLTACDSAIGENYGYGDPSGVTLPKDNFSVRWSLTRDFGSGGPFRLAAATQDGMRVYVDGVRKIDLWKNVSTTARKTVDLTIPAQAHDPRGLRRLDRLRLRRVHVRPAHRGRRRHRQAARPDRPHRHVRPGHHEDHPALGREQGDGPRRLPRVPPAEHHPVGEGQRLVAAHLPVLRGRDARHGPDLPVRGPRRRQGGPGVRRQPRRHRCDRGPHRPGGTDRSHGRRRRVVGHPVLAGGHRRREVRGVRSLRGRARSSRWARRPRRRTAPTHL
ncbi:PA14 domain-containing protein [Streptomyces kaempferi]